MTPRPHPARHALSACAALCLLTACGGGGGDSLAATPVPAPAPTAVALTFKCWNDVVLSSTTAQPGKADCAAAPLPVFTIEGNTPKIVFDTRLGVQSAAVVLSTPPTATGPLASTNFQPSPYPSLALLPNKGHALRFVNSDSSVFANQTSGFPPSRE